MPKIIKEGVIVEDNWRLISAETPLDSIPSDVPVIIPLAFWQHYRETFLTKKNLGIWLDSDQPPGLIADDVHLFSVIAINFPQFADGRGFSYGRELREQHNFTAELRAIGDFMRDQLFYLKRCGFNAFALRDTNLEEAIKSLNGFSEYYQGAIDQPQPLFNRR